MQISEVSRAFKSQNDTASGIMGREFRSVNQTLLETFFTPLKLATGKWVRGGHWWHAYSFGHQHALSGDSAVSAYSNQEANTFIVYYEDVDHLFDCTANNLPDLRPLKNDIYVFPHDMAWLYSMTHEHGLGPYFDESTA